jgi:hypothetical protein
MIRKTNYLVAYKTHFVILTAIILLSVGFLPIVSAVNVDRVRGFDKGPSYLPVVPLKNVILVDHDEDSYLDDYSYLASVPAAVFQDNGRLFSCPLLFFDDPYPVKTDEERTLNARQGLDYFMEDWMSYCNGRLDQMTLINVPKSKLDSSWSARDYDLIDGDDPYSIAADVALNDWSYSDDVVVAVIGEDFETPVNVTSSFVEGMIPADREILEKTFYSPQLDKLNPRFHYFDVPEGYKYLKSRTWWACFEVGTATGSALPIGIHVAIPAADPDSQLYCKYNGEWMEASVTQGWNIGGMDRERAETYVYKSGPWRLGITDIPTHALGGRIERYGRFVDIIRNMLRGATYQTDITMFPGVEVVIPDEPPFGCRDATFKLTSSSSDVRLGFSIIGPSGEEIVSASEEDVDFQEIHLNQLGELLDGESYRVSVFALDELSGPVNFRVEYSWQQNFSRAEADSLSSATEGAVLASVLNAPLLYTSADGLPQKTKDALYKLGIENIYLVDLGDHLLSDARKELRDVAYIVEEYEEPVEVYEAIRSVTGENDIIFSTIDPWSSWVAIGSIVPGNKTEAGLFIGPAAYCAAHHGSPVLIIDNHPEFSSAVVWHTEFWRRHANGFREPSVAEMFLTGTRVYDFLKKLDYDKEGMESMITVAGQYEVGATWDRTFTGKAKPGRIYGHPVDTAYWISRSVFYPALIFNNPGAKPEGVTMVQGSTSERRKLLAWGNFGLKITNPSQEETFKYPVIQLYVCYEHEFNEAVEKYYGFQYKSADDIVPGVTESFNSIDDGMVPGKEGAVWPDLSMTEVIPAYLEKGGYSNVFSTNPEALTGNLNKGAILLITSTHGTSGNSGFFQVWDPENSGLGMLPDILFNRIGYSKEPNPWRAYDWILGSTENPDTLTMEVHGFIPALLGNPNMNGLFPTGEDFWPSEKPILHALTNLPIIKWFMPAWLKDSSYYKDGMVIAHSIGSLAVSGISGLELDLALDNLHSVGWINTACLPAYNYMHLTMIRHGSIFQVIDPWATSWYGCFWSQSIPRDIILGDTIGEAYTKGMSHVGILYLTDPPQWWWDILNNVCFFGDPDLRPFVPSTEYSDANYWTQGETKSLRYNEEVDVDGHMPFGATNYPNERDQGMFLEQYLLWILVILVIIILIAAIVVLSRKKR